MNLENERLMNRRGRHFSIAMIGTQVTVSLMVAMIGTQVTVSLTVAMIGTQVTVSLMEYHGKKSLEVYFLQITAIPLHLTLYNVFVLL